MAEGRFVTAINCMDGRVQEPVFRWMTRRLGADYVDMITEAGPDGILASPSTAADPNQAARRDQLIESIRQRALISVQGHFSRVVAIVGHHDCAGNPVDDDTHQAQVRESFELLRSWGLGIRLLGLWVNHRWTVAAICDSESALA